ncbi:hypothetical protein [Paraburkholderia antibiotica]|uniref:Uncharacterized protein n=1 Tax=Paraburkholderia antibiotica TaxID=2728839 RepID=A0A7X9ZWF7_9BURK|nr:hypothetical protein [Paraburkholderia antibiotica]NML30907.1 hypothetical protein [Paraburkholderia antibiotica]
MTIVLDDGRVLDDEDMAWSMGVSTAPLLTLALLSPPPFALPAPSPPLAPPPPHALNKVSLNTEMTTIRLSRFIICLSQRKR